MKKRMWIINLAVLVLLQLVLVMPSMAKGPGDQEASGDYAATDISLTPGADASKLNFAWITDDSDDNDQCAVLIANKKEGFKKANIFTSKRKGKKSTVFTNGVEVGEAYEHDTADYYYCHVEVSNLKNQTDYVYKVGNGKEWSDYYNYSTQNRNRFGFVALSDAQIGASMDTIYGNADAKADIAEYMAREKYPYFTDDEIQAIVEDYIDGNLIDTVINDPELSAEILACYNAYKAPPPPPPAPPTNQFAADYPEIAAYIAAIKASLKPVAEANDGAGWADTLATMHEAFPDTAFILSAGDQIEVPGDVNEWSLFFYPPELRTIPLAPTAGSHDHLGSGKGAGPVTSYAFDYHFYRPNEADPLINDRDGMPLASGDYYFTYGNALIMVLNMDSTDYDAHEEFLQAAVDANPRAKWRIVMWHYTIYSSSGRGLSVDRAEMVSMMDSLDIDLVFMAHDHVFCRTHQMLADEAMADQIVNDKGEVVNPTGTLYMTINSASGSKYNSVSGSVVINPDKTVNPDWYWVAAYGQPKLPGFSYVSVDANNLKITTYVINADDTISEYDDYSIVKLDPPKPRPPLKK